jgi:hypothetical protein
MSLKYSKLVAHGKAFYNGFRDTDMGMDLVVWLEKKVVKAVRVSLMGGVRD